MTLIAAMSAAAVVCPELHSDPQLDVRRGRLARAMPLEARPPVFAAE
ncbi:hypothetical protein KO481_18315 [Nocardia sp. NEAU-G5]|uniref:Uncharacterized protein n=1 Tax=Nocardia albiluteola TaxID=2842303 RepID=A0ABS6B2K0_9NOCA|nr:hypothetical protein [Nocardia albiluteola]MBU3063478.1 hypothetical protein [Nocardia albiluteola]